MQNKYPMRGSKGKGSNKDRIMDYVVLEDGKEIFEIKNIEYATVPVRSLFMQYESARNKNK